MWITIDQATEMYARFCRARYGARAVEIAEEKLSELRNRDDIEGQLVWAKVKTQLERQHAN